MATNITELRRRVALLIDRDDAHEQMAYDGTEVDMLSFFINNAEKRVYRDELSRIPPFEFTVTYTVEEGTTELALPENYFSQRYAEASRGDQRVIMERTSVDEIRTTGNTDAQVYLPRQIAYGSNNFVIRPPSDEITIDLYYYSSLGALQDQTADTDDHWLLNQADDLLYYYAAVEASLYYTSLTGMTEVWELKAKDIRDSILMQDRRARQSGGTPRIRRKGAPPRISPNIGTFG